MLSPSLSEMLERARTRFGVEVEVLDATLRHLYPDSATALARTIKQSPGVRQQLLEALAEGRSEELVDGGVQYQVYPLRRTAQFRKASALIAVRRARNPTDSTQENDWPELARAMIEADLAAADALSAERQQSRRLLATLRFLRYLAETDGEGELATAIVQAAAVWFDVDARVYERGLSGDFSLHTALPGALLDDVSKTLDARWVSGASDSVRLGPSPEWGSTASGSEMILVPVSLNGSPDWVLALIGVFPAGAESIVATLGRIVAGQLERIRSRRRDSVQGQFETILQQPGRIPELLLIQFVRELVEATSAADAALVLNRHGLERRLVSIGTTAEMPGAVSNTVDGWHFGPTEIICALPLGESVFVTLALRSQSGKTFTRGSELVTRVAARLLQGWLVASDTLIRDVSSEPVPPAVSEFVGRIEEELERAKRFDLRLSLVLIDIGGAATAIETASRVQDAVRRELRGSDVLGTMNDARLAALLTHTDDSGSSRVVGRLRHRLAEAAARLNLPSVRVGHAAFSPDCRTAEAMLSQAARAAQSVFQ
jgi:hypothetical protein